MDILNNLGITIHATFIPHDTPAGESPTLRWRVSVRRNGQEFHAADYSAGCAHAPEYKKSKALTAAVKAECETGIVYGSRIGTAVPPPDVADVIHSLLMDASGTDEQFEDWAGNYGFDPDSRTAERIYHACQETAAALRRAFAPDELAELETAFADY